MGTRAEAPTLRGRTNADQNVIASSSVPYSSGPVKGKAAAAPTKAPTAALISAKLSRSVVRGHQRAAADNNRPSDYAYAR